MADDSLDFRKATTPPVDELIRAGFDYHTLDMMVSMPGIVQTYDRTKNVCSVQPALMRLYEDDADPTQLPIINNVPVWFPRGQKFRMHWNLYPDDVVQLVFAHRSLDIWKSQGGVVDPDDPRRFHLSDAIAYPGGYPVNAPIPEAADGQFVLVNDKTKIILQDAGQATITTDQGTLEMTNAGKFKLSNGTNELLTVLDGITTQLDTLANTLSTDTVNTIFGPMQLNAFTTYAAIKSQLDTLKSQLETLKE